MGATGKSGGHSRLFRRRRQPHVTITILPRYSEIERARPCVVQRPQWGFSRCVTRPCQRSSNRGGTGRGYVYRGSPGLQMTPAYIGSGDEYECNTLCHSCYSWTPARIIGRRLDSPGDALPASYPVASSHSTPTDSSAPARNELSYCRLPVIWTRVGVCVTEVTRRWAVARLFHFCRKRKRSIQRAAGWALSVRVSRN